MVNPLGPLYSIQFIALILCAVAWYKAADVENEPPWLWAGLSIGAFCLTWLWLGWGWPGILFGQGALLVGITLLRAWKSHRESNDQHQE